MAIASTAPERVVTYAIVAWGTLRYCGPPGIGIVPICLPAASKMVTASVPETQIWLLLADELELMAAIANP